MPPIGASLTSKAKLRFWANQPSTRRVASITSGPMPSPGVTRILCVILNPRCVGAVFGFVGGNLVLAAHGQADIVPAVEQALLAEGIDLELDAAAVRTADFLRFQIDRDAGIGAALGIVHQLVDVFLRQLDGQDAVLEAIAIEDVGEIGRDDAADAE